MRNRSKKTKLFIFVLLTLSVLTALAIWFTSSSASESDLKVALYEITPQNTVIDTSYHPGNCFDVCSYINAEVSPISRPEDLAKKLKELGYGYVSINSCSQAPAFGIGCSVSANRNSKHKGYQVKVEYDYYSKLGQNKEADLSIFANTR